MGTDVTIKSFDDMLYRRFKAEAIRQGKTVKEAIAEAMQMWIRDLQRTTPRDIIRIRNAMKPTVGDTVWSPIPPTDTSHSA